MYFCNIMLSYFVVVVMYKNAYMITAHRATRAAGVYIEVCSEGMSIVQFKWVETTPQMWYRYA